MGIISNAIDSMIDRAVSRKLAPQPAYPTQQGMATLEVHRISNGLLLVERDPNRAYSPYEGNAQTTYCKDERDVAETILAKTAARKMMAQGQQEMVQYGSALAGAATLGPATTGRFSGYGKTP